jgi:hypothetical protein
MLPPCGNSPAERWVHKGIRAAGLDLLEKLRSLDLDLEHHVLGAEDQDVRLFVERGARGDISKRPFHFGQALAAFILEHEPQVVAYFGAGSAPLICAATIEDAFLKANHAKHPEAVVNNFHSTDWAIFNLPHNILDHANRLPSDNPLGWVLETEAGYAVASLEVSAETRSDIDTPTDLRMIARHPHLGPHLSLFLKEGSPEGDNKMADLLSVFRESARTLTLIGRSSSHIWKELERRTQLWVRFYVEERGMVASGRLKRGEVRSLIAALIDERGTEGFIAMLEQISDAVLWDTRVWMAHNGGWPSRSDRFASDLGWTDQVHDPALKELTQAVAAAKIPIILGGHGAVSGGVLALLESISAGPDHQPERN